MKNMVPVAALILGMLIGVGGAYGAEAKDLDASTPRYALDDLYRMTLDRAEKIKISAEDVHIARKDREKAKASLIPTLAAFGSHTRYSEEKSMTMDFGGFSFSSTTQPEWASSWGAKLSQTITLNGKEYDVLTLADTAVTQSEYAMQAIKEAYLFEVALGYYTVLRAIKGRETAEADVQRLEKHKEAVMLRLQVETVPKTALFRAEAELSGARTQLTGAANGVRLAYAVLAGQVGLSGPFCVADTPEKTIHIVESDLVAYQKTATTSRVEIKALETSRKLALDEVRVAKGDFWPTVSAEAVYASTKTAGSDEEDSLYAQVSLNFLVLEGGWRSAQVDQAMSRKRQADLSLDALKRQIAVEVEQAFLDVMTQQSALVSLSDQLRFAEENFKAVSFQFEHGLADSIDVMDANTLLKTAEKQLVDARYGHEVAVIKLAKAKGDFFESLASWL